MDERIGQLKTTLFFNWPIIWDRDYLPESLLPLELYMECLFGTLVNADFNLG